MPISIDDAINSYLGNVELSRSINTTRSYKNALKLFKELLVDRDIAPSKIMVGDLKVDSIGWFSTYLKDYSPATESLYITAVAGFYEYLAAENISKPNLPRMRLLIRHRKRKTGQRLPEFPRDDIDFLISYSKNIVSKPAENEKERLRNLRDRAFLLTLADTGLRVHEICSLRRGDIDWNEGKALIIGKGDHQDVIRFSNRSLNALKEYLRIRTQQLDGKSGRPLSSLPLFCRHDRGAGTKVKPISTDTGRNIVKYWVREALGDSSEGKITPHSFRHYFVTTVLIASGGNLKLAQELARHKNIAVTQRYAHLSNDQLDKGYWEIFNN
jgi:site-specific recombinase XerD